MSCNVAQVSYRGESWRNNNTMWLAPRHEAITNYYCVCASPNQRSMSANCYKTHYRHFKQTGEREREKKQQLVVFRQAAQADLCYFNTKHRRHSSNMWNKYLELLMLIAVPIPRLVPTTFTNTGNTANIITALSLKQQQPEILLYKLPS